MAVLFFINQYASTPENGFAGRYYYLAKELNEKGSRAILVTSSNHHLLREPVEFKGLWHWAVFDGLPILWLKTFKYKKANSPIRVLNWFLFAFYMPFLSLLKVTPSAYHYSSPSPVGFIGVWLLGKLKGVSTCFDVRDVWPETLVEIGGVSEHHIFIKFLYRVESFCYRKADRITSNLANFNLRLSELGMPMDKFTWVPNGISLKDIQESYGHSNIKLPSEVSGKFVIGYTGTFGEANALDKLLDLAEYLIDDKEIMFLLVGHGKDRVGLEEQCRLKKLTNVVFHSAVPKKDIYKLQKQCDVLCVGAKESPLYRYGVAANKLYEYIYAGVPVLYYINTPNYHPVSDSGSGIEVPLGDVVRLASAIYRMKAMSIDELSNLETNAKAYVEKYHLYSSISNKLVTESLFGSRRK